MLNKISFSEINNKNSRPIVLFGSGNIAKKTIRKLDFNQISFIVDNSLNLQGSKFEKLDIRNPEKITKNHFIIICSTALSDISTQLNSYGLLENKDFIISPILNDLLAISELEELVSTFYFTSGTAVSASNDFGGGLYKCSIKGTKHNVEKIYSGPCYGAIRKDNSILFVDTDKGLMHLENNKIKLLTELPNGSRPHGISYNISNKKHYITCSYLDSVIELNDKYQIERYIKISNKIDRTKEPMHHCNDNLAINDSLYVSMFSSSGSWKDDIFDGCIAEFSIESGDRLNNIAQNLYMPHNIKLFDGSIHILDSLPGHLRFNNLSIQGTFPAFTRGLDYNKGLYYIGQSKNRNYSKVLGISNNISIDCGVIIFNSELKASRFLQFPNAIGEIHSIVF